MGTNIILDRLDNVIELRAHPEVGKCKFLFEPIILRIISVTQTKLQSMLLLLTRLQPERSIMLMEAKG